MTEQEKANMAWARAMLVNWGNYQYRELPYQIRHPYAVSEINRLMSMRVKTNNNDGYAEEPPPPLHIDEPMAEATGRAVMQAYGSCVTEMQILMMRFCMGGPGRNFTTDEISRELRIEPDAARQRLQRIIRNLFPAILSEARKTRDGE